MYNNQILKHKLGNVITIYQVISFFTNKVKFTKTTHCVNLHSSSRFSIVVKLAQTTSRYKYIHSLTTVYVTVNTAYVYVHLRHHILVR